jgi:hypothetical protein
VLLEIDADDLGTLTREHGGGRGADAAGGAGDHTHLAGEPHAVE